MFLYDGWSLEAPDFLSFQLNLASKIIGQLLEMENSELLHLLDTSDALGAKMKELSSRTSLKRITQIVIVSWSEDLETSFLYDVA